MLVLEANRISSWADIATLSHLPKLASLLLSNNQIPNVLSPCQEEGEHLCLCLLLHEDRSSWLWIGKLGLECVQVGFWPFRC